MKSFQKYLSATFLGALLICLLLVESAPADQVKDIIYFGNSFTNATCCGGTRSVPNIVSDIAVAAGHQQPRSINAAVNGQSLEWHRMFQSGVITTAIAPGEQWEHIVLQDFSTQPTHVGNLALHRSSTLAMYELAVAHSPDVSPILFETWARGPGHSFYSDANPSFPGGPTQMQQELRDGYLLSAQDINIAAGSDVARYAPVGDAWENAGFPLTLYSSDRYHAQNRGSLLSALVLYGTIYQDRTTSDIELSTVFSTLNISPEDGAFLTMAADSTLVPEPSTAVLACGVACVFLFRRSRTRVT